MISERKKTLGVWALGALSAVIGSYYCFHKPYKEAITLPVPSELSEEIPDGGRYNPHFVSPDARIPYGTLNDLIRDVREILNSGIVPQSEDRKYILFENFPTTGAAFDELTDLFYEDCAGRCFYQENSDGTITKIEVNSKEGIKWYDEILGDELGCHEFQGGNFWLYIDDSGNIKAWGIGRESKIEASEIYRRCK